jgi:leucyl-tRNA synthetase
MGTRRKGRELALQALYQLDLTCDASAESLHHFWGQCEASPGAREFAAQLVDGVLQHRAEIDRLVEEMSEHWRIERLSRVDLNVIRIAVYELTAGTGLPREVAIDEAIEVARRFGTEESAGFVNGILDPLARRLADSEGRTRCGRKMDERYDPRVVEEKWQRRWREREDTRVDLSGARRPYYNLMMFPYPSAEGLHIGHAFAFTGGDIHGRFRRMQGWNVFQPMGFDAFGIHAENYALKVGEKPQDLVPRVTANFRRQLDRLGAMFEWEHQVDTTHPDYYRWTQWIFLQLYKHGLAFRRKAPVNWCPRCKTVLANEQVVDGYCERHWETQVEQRFLEQWFFGITRYAQRLLDNLERIDWSATTKRLQANWIGRSEGAEIDFPLAAEESRVIRVFTTRPDTLFGATYMVLAPEHPLVDEITTSDRRALVDDYRRKAAAMDVVSRRTTREKSGVFTGAFAVNPATASQIPVWIADYVLMEYGTGAIMAVPAHDERDFEFAKAFELPIIRVIAPEGVAADAPVEDVHTGSGRLVHSAPFDGQEVEEAKRNICTWLEEKGSGKSRVEYRLHDWCISRQRYWGPPIPVVYCEGCGIVPVPESELPVLLPDLDDIRPDESGVAPLARAESFYRVSCPACGRPARRETDVSDTFLDSAWYFLRYPSALHGNVAFDPDLTDKWLPVNRYTGGNEHACMHLLYARFLTMALHDLGLLSCDEPFDVFRAHGLIIKDGAKMSKARGNVVNPDESIDQHGADTIRLYLMFLGPYEEGGDFRAAGIPGVRGLLEDAWRLVRDLDTKAQAGENLRRATHRAIKKITEDVESLSYNTAVAALMTLRNEIKRNGPADIWVAEAFTRLLAPFAPHIGEELWEALGHDSSVFDASWPTYDEAMLREDEVVMVVQVNGRVRGKIQVARDAGEDVLFDRALADDGVRAHIGDKPIRRKIVVPGKLINLVV